MKNSLKTSVCLLICYICLVSAGCDTKTNIILSEKVVAYQDTKLTISGINVKDYFFKTSDNAQLLYLMNDTFRLTALDTNEITITAQEKRGMKKLIYTLAAKNNPAIKSAWKTAPPTGFLLHERFLYGNFEIYKTLHKPFTHFTLQDADGKDFSEKDLSGKTTMIDCWGYGCATCVAEIENLNKMKTELETDSNIQLLSFYNKNITKNSTGDNLFESAVTMISDNGKITSGTRGFKKEFNFRHIKNAAGFMKKVGVYIYPTKIFIDKKGIVRYIYCGGGGNIAFYENKLEEIDAIYCGN